MSPGAMPRGFVIICCKGQCPLKSHTWKIATINIQPVIVEKISRRVQP